MTSQTVKTHYLLIAARHVVGMMIAALLWRDIYKDINPIQTWMVAWLGSLLISAFFFGLYALFFTRRAKNNWPTAFYSIAWLLLALIIAQPWLESFNASERAREKELKIIEQKFSPNNLTEKDILENKSSTAESKKVISEPKNTDPIDLFEYYGIKVEPKSHSAVSAPP